MTYSFTLERYKPGGSNRYTCPSCGKRKCFSRYVNTETGNYLDENVGKCDHENSCGYHYTPKAYYLDHPKEKEYVQSRPSHIINKVEQKKEIKKPIAYIDRKYVEQSHKPASQFMKWLQKSIDRPADIERVFNEYQLGATRDGGVIYWQIDIYDNIRTGKVMHYWSNGHRISDREDYAKFLGITNNASVLTPTYFIHSTLIKQGILPKDTIISQCFFGEHLLKERHDDIICLVESEKSAVICSIFYPQFVWIATGGGGALSLDKLKVLKGRKVIVYPDSGEYEAWLKIMKETEGISYSVVKDLETYPSNTDIADLIPSPALDSNSTDISEQETEIPDDIFCINKDPCPF